MPVTSSFKCFHPFPVDQENFECAPRVDVDSFDYWTTLSGFKKGQGVPSDQQIFDSLDKAMQFFWNWFEVRGDITTKNAEGDESTVSSLNTNGDNDDFSIFEPNERICFTIDEVFSTEKEDTTAPLATATLRVNEFYPVRMFNAGAFVGWGYSVLIVGTSRVQGGPICQVELSSFTSESGTFEGESVGYTIIDGFEFACKAYYDNTGGGSGTALALTRTATFQGGVGSNAGDVLIDELEVYNYLS